MSPERKRKRDFTTASTNGTSEAINMSVAPAGDFPPILASFHGITLPPTLQLTPYIHQIDPPPKRPRRAEEFILHGATPRIHYEGRELPEDTDYRRHYVGIYDPATNSVELHAAPKVHFSRTIKAHLERDLEIDGKGIVLSNVDSRTALGKEFGTKKSQKRLRDRELNKIDVSDMNKSITTSIVSQVEENTKDMPTAAELGAQLREGKPIPKANREAKVPEDVYNLNDIIGSEEWNVIWVREWERGEDLKCKSTFVQSRIQKLSQDKSRKHTKVLKILKYISYMIDFYLFQQKARGRLPAMDRTKKALSLDQVLVEGLFKRFTEKTISAEKGHGDANTVSPALANKLLYYTAVLCLMVDQYDVDIYELKIDLGLQPKELVMAFREVGCSIRELTKQQFEAMKMTKAEASQHKRAVLKIPLEFPKPPTRRAARR